MDFYETQSGSPVTTLADSISDTDKDIVVDNGDKLPDAPNIVTIFDEDDFETVMYEGTASNMLTQCTRGFEGEAQSWPSGTEVARLLTAFDINSLQNMFPHGNEAHTEDYVTFDDLDDLEDNNDDDDDDTLDKVSDFEATPLDSEVGLNWYKPGGASSVLIMRDTNDYPSNPNEGEFVYDGSDESYLDEDLENDTTYYYSIWANYDGDLSDAVQESATPVEGDR